MSDTPTGATATFAAPWRDEPFLVALLGLAPLLAGSQTLPGGLALGLATLAVLVASNVLSSALAGWIAPGWRPAAFLLLLGGLVTAVDLAFQARWYDLHRSVALFVPLIVASGYILGRVEAERRVGRALQDGITQGLGCAALLAGVGGLRELLAPSLPSAALPASIFFLLAALVALRRFLPGRRGRE
jgi:electron transport complex protein RnfE